MSPMVDRSLCLNEPVMEQGLVQRANPILVESCRNSGVFVTCCPCLEPEHGVGVKMLIRWPTDHNSAVPENSELARRAVVDRSQQFFEIVRRDWRIQVKVQGGYL